MTPRAEQFRVTLPDGLTIERLPVGLANGHWYFMFVCSGLDFSEGDPPRAVHFLDEFRARVNVSAMGGRLESRGGGGGGGEDVQEVWNRYSQNGVTAVELTYLHEGRSFANEVVDLS